MRRYLNLLMFFFPFVGSGQIITTIAGGGTSTADSVSCLNANLSNPGGLVFDSKGNLYVTIGPGNSKVRKIDQNGIITTFAGTGVSGFSGDGGLAVNAQLNYCVYLAIDFNDNIYIADGANHRIRKVDTNGIITTIAGNGTMGYGGDGGLATSAALFTPQGLSFDGKGNLYVGDRNNHRIRKIDTTGIITTIAGVGTMGFSGDNGLAINAELNSPWRVISDWHGNIYIADWQNNRVRKVDTNGVISTVVGNGNGQYIMDGLLATTAGITAWDIVLDANDNLIIADDYNDRIHKVDVSTGIIMTIVGTGVPGFSGDGGVATNAQIHLPQGLAVDTCGNLFISEVQNKRIRKVTYNPSCFPLNIATRTPLSFTLSPNPITSQLVITSNTKIKDITVTNTLGQVVHKTECRSERERIDVSELSSGVYFVKVVDVNGSVRVEKVVKE